jgi:Ni/Co efflux regulator RcnB
MNKLLIALLTAAFAASPAYVAAQTTAPAKDEKKAEAKKDEKKAEAKTAEAKKDEKKADAKKEEKKKPKGGC